MLSGIPERFVLFKFCTVISILPSSAFIPPSPLQVDAPYVLPRSEARPILRATRERIGSNMGNYQTSSVL